MHRHERRGRAILSKSDDLISVYEAANATEAHLVMNLLLDEGIEASVLGEIEPFSLVNFPSGVLVRREDEARARAIIQRYDEEQIARADRPDWKCPACGANVIGAFDECDACGAPKPGTEEED
jgi:putative signal transducing protein